MTQDSPKTGPNANGEKTTKKREEEELEEGLKETFPASDPPANTQPGHTQPVPSSGYKEKDDKQDKN